MTLLRLVFSGLIITQLAFSTAGAAVAAETEHDRQDIGFSEDDKVTAGIYGAAAALEVGGLFWIEHEKEKLEKVIASLRLPMDEAELAAQKIKKQYRRSFEWRLDSNSSRANIQKLNALAGKSKEIHIISRYGGGQLDQLVLQTDNLSKAIQVLENFRLHPPVGVGGMHWDAKIYSVEYDIPMPKSAKLEVKRLSALSNSFAEKKLVLTENLMTRNTKVMLGLTGIAMIGVLYRMIELKQAQN